MISGIVVSLLMASFLGIVRWAWSARRQRDFDIAAHAPLHDEEQAR